MAQGPEGRLIDKIHRQTNKHVKPNGSLLIYHQKMNMAPGSPAGTPDVYYESNNGSLWIEYKQIPSWDNKRTIPINKLSSNQLTWLTRAISNNIQCAVIMGDSKGRCLLLLNKSILNPPDIKDIILLSPTQITEAIYSLICK